MRYLNLGCGGHYHPDWTNVDFVSTGEGVIAHNLRQGLPFPEASFDAVYHSHVLEHFPRAEAPFFLQECLRVLRSGGILRVVIPDLEQIARLYLQALEQASQGSAEWVHHYDWIMLEMYDQTVRDRSGGGMADYLAADPVHNQNFVIQRLGREAKSLIAALQQSKQNQQSHPVEIPLSERESLLHSLLGDIDYRALQIGRFRQSGEVHQWMYDRYSLSRLLEQVGFERVRICQANESAIPNFGDYQLDVEPDGQIRKPDSLFVEAVKPAEAIQPIASKAFQPLAETPALPQPLEELPQFQQLQQTVQQLQVKLERSQRQLKTTQSALMEAENTIKAMSSSKFWQLRSLWIAVKQRIGL
jgi:SAM-dependent methyltransferase